MKYKDTIKYKFLAIIIAIFLVACNWTQDIANSFEPTTEPPLENAAPAPIPWAIIHRNPHSGMFGVAWNPASIQHPLLTTDRVMREMYNLLYDSLFVLDQEFNAHERLCAEIKSVDNITFILTLRQDISFNDGQPLTARDVFNSIQAARSSASPYSARLACIVSVRVDGENIEIVLDKPNPRFAALLTFPIVGVQGDGIFWAGTGPYEYIHDNERDYLVPFAGHWAKTELPLGRIELIAADRLEELTYLMGAGEVSIVTVDINDDFSVSYSGDYDVWEYPTPTMYYIGFNAAHTLLMDSNVRRALSYAFDRQGLVDNVFGKAADAAALPVSPAAYASGNGFDLRVFAEIMQELDAEDVSNIGILSFRRGRNYIPFTLRIITEEEDTRATAAAKYLAAELIKSGVGIEVVPLSAAEYRAAKISGNYELFCEKITLPADFSVKRWLSPQRATNTSITTDYADFYREMPIAPLLFKREFALTHWSQVSGIQPVYGNPYVNISDWRVRQ
jgi:peptide/nickel transport system substrate-binding protein